MTATALLSPFEKVLHRLYGTKLSDASLNTITSEYTGARDLDTYTEDEVYGYVWYVADDELRRMFAVPAHIDTQDLLGDGEDLDLVLDPDKYDQATRIIPARVALLASLPVSSDPL